ncbi:hypothetical protein BN000_00665 [Mycobacterium europaeum]|uniref:Uncharacterized protein n=1 Tax=Mycobacterium europaeum TaxID=761804 RepID=A0A0U1CXC2_9MYCO|nr:hypothetical protein [Mycobacterium europaeum]CQD03849.1 hypothetical protein BN000_00665 [Mycobacterium europaeum]
MSATKVNLPEQAQGVLPVGNGGTGAPSLSGLVVGNGTAAMTTVPAPAGAVVGTTDAQTLSGKTLSAPTIDGYTEGVQGLGTVTTAAAIGALSTGTMVTATLTNGDLCAFTLPSLAAGESFLLYVFQPSTTGSGTYSFAAASGQTLRWPAGAAPSMTQGAGKCDLLTFSSPDGVNVFGAFIQDY